MELYLLFVFPHDMDEHVLAYLCLPVHALEFPPFVGLFHTLGLVLEVPFPVSHIFPCVVNGVVDVVDGIKPARRPRSVRDQAAADNQADVVPV